MALLETTQRDRSIDISDALIATPYGLPRGLGGVEGAVALAGTNSLYVIGNELAWHHNGTSGVNYTSLGTPTLVDGQFTVAVRFWIAGANQTTVFNSRNNDTTTGALQIRISTAGALEILSRGVASQITVAGAIQPGRWYTVVVRRGRPADGSGGTADHKVWIDGALAGRSSGSGTGNHGEFAVAGGSTNAASAQTNTHWVSFAAVIPRPTADHVCAALSADPWLLVRPANDDAFVVSAGGTVYDVGLSEPVTASDSFSAAAVLAGALSEAASAADVVAAAAQFASALSEAASASESLSGALTLPASLSEAASADDSIAASAVFASALTESASAGDTVSASAELSASLSESAMAVDEIDGSIGAATYAAALSESASASDSWAVAGVLVASLVEAVDAQDVQSASALMSAVLSEIVTAGDSIAAAGVYAAAIAEAASAGDGWSESATSVYDVALSEAVSAADAWSATAAPAYALTGKRGARGAQIQTVARMLQSQRVRRIN